MFFKLLTRYFLWLPLFYVFSSFSIQVVPPVARVTDLTNTFTASQKQELEGIIQRFEQKKGSQLAILMIPSTQPETIEQYSIRVAESWQLGRKGVDDGVLLLIAKNDRAVRIEVGYGLEGVLPDIMADQIIQENIIPAFRTGNFYEGTHRGLKQIIRVINGEALPPPQSKKGHAQEKSKNLSGFMIASAIVAFLASIFLGRRMGGSLVTSMFLGWMLWFTMGSLLLSILIGIFVFINGLLIGHLPTLWSGGLGGWQNDDDRFNGGGWQNDDDGFNGGGGGFGGGGASGRW